MSIARVRPHSVEDLPKAKLDKNWKTYLFWLVPFVAAAMAGWFVYSNVFKGGPTLHIFFEDAAGLEPGKSQVKYRGAQVGEVRDVKITPDRRKVDVKVALDPSATSLACEGSRFWIVQPQVGAEQIRGLRTIVSGDYIDVDPGSGKRQTRFIGLAEPPVIEPGDSLHLVILSEKAGSLRPRSPVFYRGIQVGEVESCELGHASQTIKITIAIKHHYAPLVRMNSRFWNAGGIHVNLSLSGINIGAQSSEALLSGGLAFATPDSTEKEAPPGTTFRLYDKAEDAWLGWAPAIELGNDKTSAGLANNTSK